MKVAVLGAGSFGTTMAALTARNAETWIWARRPEVAEAIDNAHENPQFHPGVTLPDTLRCTNELGPALAGADVVVVAVPTQFIRSTLEGVPDHVAADTPFISLAKGIEVSTLLRPTEVIVESLGGWDPASVGVLSGPNLAREILAGLPAASVLAFTNKSTAAALQGVFATDLFRIYTNTDVIGCEVGGAYKNVIAVLAGMSNGMGYGSNAVASLITRGLVEMTRLGAALGADPLTFLGLAGQGDLVATCTSTQSRNHTVGIELSKGRSIDDIVSDMKMVAEGVKSVDGILALADRHGVDAPIARMTQAVIAGRIAVTDVAQAFVSRPPKTEFDGLTT